MLTLDKTSSIAVIWLFNTVLSLFLFSSATFTLLLYIAIALYIAVDIIYIKNIQRIDMSRDADVNT